MIKAEYIHDYWGRNPIHYSLVRLEGRDSWQYFVKGTKFGEIEKINDTWQQVSGRQTMEEVISGMGEFIDNSQFSTLPLEIKNLWPEKVQYATAITENHYLIILYPDINLIDFSTGFKEIINEVIVDKWQTKFQVSNSSMNKELFIDIN